MDRNQLERCVKQNVPERLQEDPSWPSSNSSYVSLETEIPEALYRGMRQFIATNPNWDQYRVMSSALANFLFQNGCEDRVVRECYLNELFARTEV